MAIITRSCTAHALAQASRHSPQSTDANSPPPDDDSNASTAQPTSRAQSSTPGTLPSADSTHSPSMPPSTRRPSTSPKKQHGKSPYARPPTTSVTEREARVRELKGAALKIDSIGNAPVSELQRLVLIMVFDEITPYPDEAWLAQIAIIIQREYSQVKNWFSNQRQKEARAQRENSSDSEPTPSLASTLKKTLCEGRILRLRMNALQFFPEEDWTDQLFKEILLIDNFRMTMFLRKYAMEEGFGTPPRRRQ